jgi:uncharacterized LabA/DUF88 family protein
MKNSEKQIAVLIDAENVSYKLVDEIFEEIALLGRVTHRRVYGDFSTPAMSGWNAVSNDFALRQIQQRHSKNGKNSSDIVLVIDAMDILHAGKVDAICVVSNDNDFTRLAIRLVEGGLEVIGMGEEKKAGQAFVKACSTFKYLIDKSAASGIFSVAENEKLIPTPTVPAKQQALAAVPEKNAPKENARQPEAVVSPLPLSKKNVTAVIKHALASVDADPDGWVFIGAIGNVLHNRWPDFDPRSIAGVDVKGKQLSVFLKELPAFELIVRNQQHYLRLKRT